MGSTIYFDSRKFVIILLIICIPYYIYFLKFSNFVVPERIMNRTFINKTSFRTLNVSMKENYHIRYFRKSSTFKREPSMIQAQIEKPKRQNYAINKAYFRRNRNVPVFNCSKLFKSIVTLEGSLYRQFQSKSSDLMPQNYMESTRNCSAFITHRGYITHHLTSEERNFPIAFSILMYKDVEQAERLLRAIYRPQNIYCIHVDLKADDKIFNAMNNISNCFDNVFVLNKRVKVIWGEMSVLEPELLCMKELLIRNKRWKYFINLTGQEFPLKTNYELVKILQAYNGSNDVETSVRDFTTRCKNKTSAPHGIRVTKGAVHVAVSRGFVEFAIYDEKSRDILTWMNKSCDIPDEAFFTTLNHNPHLGVPGAYKGYPETTVMADSRKPYLARFKNRQRLSIYHFICRGKWVRGMCVYSHKDLPFLRGRRELFANKFHLHTFPVAYACMEELIFNRTRDEFQGKKTFNASWYSSFDFVTNKVE